jgi:hypothetical protein
MKIKHLLPWLSPKPQTVPMNPTEPERKPTRQVYEPLPKRRDYDIWREMLSGPVEFPKAPPAPPLDYGALFASPGHCRPRSWTSTRRAHRSKSYSAAHRSHAVSCGLRRSTFNEATVFGFRAIAVICGPTSNLGPARKHQHGAKRFCYSARSVRRLRTHQPGHRGRQAGARTPFA